jgi:hypothetical protein
MVMPKITLRLTIALLTFAVGIAATAFWLTRQAPKIEKLETTPCQWTFSGGKNLQRTTTNEPYFPAGTFYSDKKVDEMASGFNSDRLATMNEPVLYSLKGTDIETYRFSWFRSFHPAVAIRIWRAGNERCMSVKQLDGLGDYKDGEYVLPKNLAVNQVRPLTESEWDNFIGLLKGTHFGEMSGRGSDDRANDGASWIMEGNNGRQYHVVERQNPKDTDYGKVGVYLIKISGIKVDESRDELY